jgi:arginase
VPTIRYAIVQAPSPLGLRTSGVKALPAALLANGLAEGIGARLAAQLDPPAQDPERDPETLTLNAHAIAQWSPQLADTVEAVLDQGEFPVLLGGDCTILLGSALALKRRGRYGLLFIDGHADFYQPAAEPTGEAASMELGFATGRGPALLANIEGRGPLVADEDVVVFGFRDGDQQVEYGSQPLPESILAYDLATVRAQGAAAAVQGALRHLTRPGLDGFFIHLDADCLDDAVMPAVEYRMPDGLRLEELETVLKAAVASGKAVGIEVAIYDPELDPGDEAGRALAGVLVRGLAAGQD